MTLKYISYDKNTNIDIIFCMFVYKSVIYIK